MLELNKIYQGNCFKVMESIDDNTIDLTVTSPPYDNLRIYNRFYFSFERIARELYRITKQGGVIVWVVGDATIEGSETGTSFQQALYFKYIGFNLHDTMIYLKEVCPFPETNRYYQNFEYMFVFSKGKPKSVHLLRDRKNKSVGREVTGTSRNPDGTTSPKICLGNIVKEYGVRFNSWLISDGKRQNEHPAIFPEKLAEDHILSWSNEGDLILDPMCGSGTTCKMAIKNNRNFIGIEISQKYCDIANKRLVNTYRQMELIK